MGKTGSEKQGFTGLKDMFDGGGKGGSGSEFSNKSHDDYAKDFEARHGFPDPNAREHTVNGGALSDSASSFKRGFTSLFDMFDGGGMGGSGSERSTKSHEDYKKDYEATHGTPDPDAKSHRDSASVEVDTSSIAPTVSYTGTIPKPGQSSLIKTSTGVTIKVVAPSYVPQEVINRVVETAVAYADAVNQGKIARQTDRTSISITFADIDSNGSTVGNKFTIDYVSPSDSDPSPFNRKVIDIVATTVHELTHVYNPTLHVNGKPKERLINGFGFAGTAA